jgi:branched-chain amino acid transport system substrate-binding protein
MAKSSKETVALVATLLITAGVAGGGWFFFSKISNSPTSSPSNPTSQGNTNIATRLSNGEKILIAADTNPNKQAGVEAIANNDFSTATTKLAASLQNNPNDPEALIYLNNAKIGTRNALKIAVSIPIGSNLNVAKEILRGVAQAQDEVNQSGGINGSPLKIMIASDDNDGEIVKQVATEFVKDSSILAVVGHNASNASLIAAPIYQSSGLVMVSPTSFANNLSGIGSYIFRTVPNIRVMAILLAQQIIERDRKAKLAICFDSQAPDNVSFKDEILAAFLARGGKFSTISCDFSSPTFNPSTAISEATADGADSMLLAPHIDRLDRALEVAKVNQGRLALFGSPTLYTFKTLQNGQRDVNGIVIPAAWHPNAFPGISYANNASKRWGGDVNWRSATAYDATQAIVAGLRQSTTRDGLQKALSNPSFSATGAGEKIQFQSSGDRNSNGILIKIVPGKRSGTGYDFLPIPQS